MDLPRPPLSPRHFVTWVFLGLVAFELLRLASTLLPGAVALTSGLTGALGRLEQLCFVLLCLVGLAMVSLRERALMAAALALTLAAASGPDAGAAIADALGLAAFFGVFIALLTVLTVAATRSRAVADVGLFLTTRPAGQRFYSVAIGSHFLGTFLNFSAVSLMSPLIQQGAQAFAPDRAADLERRQLSALIRGFSWILLWAPTTLTQAVLLRLFTGVDYGRLLLLGMTSACLMILIGRALDRIEWRKAVPAAPGPRPALPGREVRIVALICAALLVLTYGGVFITGFSVAEALMFTAPAITLAWLALQSRTERLAGNRPAPIPGLLGAAVPGLARSAIALGLSGYIGRLAAHVLPTEAITGWLGAAHLPEWAFLAVLPVLITLGGQVALSPIVFVVFLGEVIAGMPVAPADPTLTVYALSLGWALSMTASPNATATLLISATTGIAPTVLTWKWNLRYGILCYLAFVAISATLAGWG